MKVALDFDGTLVDSKERHIQVFRYALKHISESKSIINFKEYLDYKISGFSTKTFCLDILKLSNEEAALINECWIKNIENNEFLSFDVLYSDSIPFLDKLKTKVELYLLTARCNREGLKNEIERLKVNSYFKDIKVVSPFNPIKEKGDYLRKEKIDILIGDSEVDFYSAEQAKVKTYILNRGFRSKEFWDKLGIYSFKDLHSIANIIMSTEIKSNE